MFDLTQEERKVVLFLTAVVLVGTVIGYCLKKYSPVRSLGSLYQELGKIDLNQADSELLKRVPGIGEKLAQRIILKRQELVGFSCLDDLRGVKGVTESRYEKLKCYLRVE